VHKSKGCRPTGNQQPYRSDSSQSKNTHRIHFSFVASHNHTHVDGRAPPCIKDHILNEPNNTGPHSHSTRCRDGRPQGHTSTQRQAYRGCTLGASCSTGMQHASKYRMPPACGIPPLATAINCSPCK
jgi:hypothetical protein